MLKYKLCVLNSLILFKNQVLVAWRDTWPQHEIVCNVYSPSCLSKPVLHYCFTGTQETEVSLLSETLNDTMMFLTSKKGKEELLYFSDVKNGVPTWTCNSWANIYRRSFISAISLSECVNCDLLTACRSYTLHHSSPHHMRDKVYLLPD